MRGGENEFNALKFQGDASGILPIRLFGMAFSEQAHNRRRDCREDDLRRFKVSLRRESHCIAAYPHEELTGICPTQLHSTNRTSRAAATVLCMPAVTLLQTLYRLTLPALFGRRQ